MTSLAERCMSRPGRGDSGNVQDCEHSTSNPSQPLFLCVNLMSSVPLFDLNYSHRASSVVAQRARWLSR